MNIHFFLIMYTLFYSSRNINTGVFAITCYLHACRHQNESKSRKYLAKVLWLLTYDDDKSTLAEAVDKYNTGVPPVQWLPWWEFIGNLGSCIIIWITECEKSTVLIWGAWNPLDDDTWFVEFITHRYVQLVLPRTALKLIFNIFISSLDILFWVF